MHRYLVGILLLLSAVVFAGCSADELPGAGSDKLQAVSFTAAMKQESSSRVTADGNSWLAGDAVGIFMLTAGGNTLPGDLVDNVDNRKYTVQDATNGTLTPADNDQIIYYPQTGTVDFIAYYPYGSKGTTTGQVSASYTYPIDVTNQGQPEILDVLYSNNAKGKLASPTVLSLTFAHVMGKITLDVKAGTGIDATDISGLATTDVVFGKMPVTASLALASGTVTAGTDLAQTFSPLKAATATTGYDATFTAILVPQAAGTYSGRTVVFTIAGQPYTWNIPDTEAFAAGQHIVYPVTVNRTGITVGDPTITGWNINDTHAPGVSKPV